MSIVEVVKIREADIAAGSHALGVAAKGSPLKRRRLRACSRRELALRIMCQMSWARRGCSGCKRQREA